MPNTISSLLSISDATWHMFYLLCAMPYTLINVGKEYKNALQNAIFFSQHQFHSLVLSPLMNPKSLELKKKLF